MKLQNFLVIFFFKTKGNINPFDIGDQVTKELAGLKAIVQGQIGMATNNIDSYHITYQIQSANEFQSGQVALDSQLQTIKDQIQTLENLGASAGVDATNCTKRENIIEDVLYFDYGVRLQSCIESLSGQAAQLVEDAIYSVDIIINKVNSLEFQVRQCNGGSSCLSDILTLVQNYNIILPQNIQLEANNAKNYLDTLFVSVGKCSDTNIDDFVIEANSIIAEMTTCVNDMLD